MKIAHRQETLKLKTSNGLNNMKTTQDLSNQKKDPEPPEADFFKPPEIKGVQAFKRSFKNPLIKGGTFFLGFIVLVWMLFGSRPVESTKSQNLPQDEKRIVMTTASMERAIDASARGTKTETRKSERGYEKQTVRKRNSEIAVFVLKPEKEEKKAPTKSTWTKEKLGLPSGLKVPAMLTSRIFSFNVDVPVIAEMEKDFVYDGKVMIPKNSRFLGEAGVVKSLNRINVRFDLLIFPDGRELKIRGLALSEDGSSGIKGEVDKHTDRKVLKAIGESLLAGASLFTGRSQSDPFSLEDQMRLNLTQNLTNQASQDLRSTKIETSVTVEAYTPIYVILLEAI